MEGRAFLNTSNSNRDPSSAVARTSCSCSKIDRVSARVHLIRSVRVMMSYAHSCVRCSPVLSGGGLCWL